MVNKKTTPGFCSGCGSVLPLPKLINRSIECFTCPNKYGPEVFEKLESNYEITFNNVLARPSKTRDNDTDENEGPIVERKCPKCGNSKMSYATLQLRSADEGQTVFYTCTNCKFKETENS